MHKGFTLIELLLVVSIFSLLTVLVLPMMGDKDKLGIDIARQLLVSDIELAQICHHYSQQYQAYHLF